MSIMALPAFAPLPPASIQSNLAPDDWEACLDAWLTLAEATLNLNSEDFARNSSDRSSLILFLKSYYEQSPAHGVRDQSRTKAALALRNACFRLVDRVFTEREDVPHSILNWDFLGHVCHAHIKSAKLSEFMSRTWKRRLSTLNPSLQKEVNNAVLTLEAADSTKGMSWLARFAPIIHALPDTGAQVMAGSDFFDSLINSFDLHSVASDHKAISNFVYHGLLSFVRVEPPNFSLLTDHLYVLKARADASKSHTSLLNDVVTNTPLTKKLREAAHGKSSERLSKLLNGLDNYNSPTIARRKVHARNVSKGKQRASDNELYVHRMSLVSQIQDLFPDLGSGFVMKLLNEYNDNIEQVTAHLLDDSLPSHLATLDRSEKAPTNSGEQRAEIDQLIPRSTPPLVADHYIPERRNVFDDDEIDALDLNTKRLHIGKANNDIDNDDQANKAAILSALAAFDSDDDERDDTYDVEDVGGTIDNAHPDGEPGISARITQEQNDMALFTAYRSSPELFGRTFDIRRGQARTALKAETGMTDEAIEGWAIMLQRDPKRLSRLEARLGAFDGRQSELASTSYRANLTDGETEDSDTGAHGNASRGGHRGRGGFRGGRGRGGRGGGNVAGASNDPGTAAAQRRKEANKGSRANHNRRDQRARKMARGGLAG